MWLAISTVVGSMAVPGGLPYRRRRRVLRLLAVSVTWSFVLRAGIVSRLARDLLSAHVARTLLRPEENNGGARPDEPRPPNCDESSGDGESTYRIVTIRTVAVHGWGKRSKMVVVVVVVSGSREKSVMTRAHENRYWTHKDQQQDGDRVRSTPTIDLFSGVAGGWVTRWT